MTDDDIAVLLAFDRHSCLSEDQIPCHGKDASLERFIRNDILIRDLDRLPRIFYRITFLGIMMAAGAKRQKIKDRLARDTTAHETARGFARGGLPLPSGRRESSLPTIGNREEREGMVFLQE